MPAPLILLVKPWIPMNADVLAMPMLPGPVLVRVKPIGAAPALTVRGVDMVVAAGCTKNFETAPSMKLIDGVVATLLIRYSWVTLLNPWNCAAAPNWS